MLPKTLAILLLAAILPTCSPAGKRARILERADRYFKAGQYDNAKIEYLNLLRTDHGNATAFQQLGRIWYEEGAPLRAAPFLLRVRELAPNNVDNRARLGRVYISVGQVAEAKKEALAILQQSPANGEAIVLLADATRTKEDIDFAEHQLQSFPERDSVSFHLASAILSFRKGDLTSAERSLRRALEVGPESPTAHLAMGTLYLAQKTPTQASAEFKTAADLAPPRSVERLRYAELKTQSREMDEAKTVLKEIARVAPDYLPAWCLSAQIAATDKKYDEALSLLENVLSRDPDNVDARVLQAEAWLSKGESKKAMDGLEQVDKTYPNVPSIEYQLARAYVQNNKPAQAATTLNRALAAKPDYLEAILALGELNLRSGNAQPVVAAMLDLLKKRPGLVQAQLLLADAYRSSGRLDDAAAIFREQIRVSSQNEQPYVFLGMVLRQAKKNDEARQAFEKALELVPDDLMVADQLVELDIARKDFDRAMRRIQPQLQKTPESAGAHFIEGKIYAARGERDRAESALLKAIALDANLSGAYDLLISIYIAADKLPQAISQLEALLAKRPEDPQPLMTLALIYDRQKDYPKARDAYEKLLSKSPNSLIALNNLAYLYAERLNQVDKAYELAQRARSLKPADPSIADTLGWVLYKRADYEQAMTLLQETADKQPGNPEIQYHFGMASYMMGQTDTARVAFQKAIKATTDFPAKEDAQRRLAFLGDGSGKTKEFSVEELETILRQQSGDVIALTRLGEAYQKQREFAKAAAAYEQAVKLNPKLLSVTTTLAQLNAGPLQSKDKALEFAKKAREIDPTNPQTAGILGAIAYQTGNFTWAYSLLQESVRQLSTDAKVLHDFAWAAYSLGKVSEARETMQRVLKSAPNSAQSEDAKSFLAMTALDDNAKNPSAIESEIQKILQVDPNYVPALMARAAIQTQRNESKTAIGVYLDVLRRWPDFAPAQKHLAVLYAADPAHRTEAYDMAMKARKVLPDDPEVAATLAEFSYQRKEYARAVQLLQESAAKKALDAKSLYYLGMAQLQVKHENEGREALDRALAAGLQDPFATEARHALKELQAAHAKSP